MRITIFLALLFASVSASAFRLAVYGVGNSSRAEDEFTVNLDLFQSERLAYSSTGAGVSLELSMAETGSADSGSYWAFEISALKIQRGFKDGTLDEVKFWDATQYHLLGRWWLGKFFSMGFGIHITNAGTKVTTRTSGVDVESEYSDEGLEDEDYGSLFLFGLHFPVIPHTDISLEWRGASGRDINKSGVLSTRIYDSLLLFGFGIKF